MHNAKSHWENNKSLSKKFVLKKWLKQLLKNFKTKHLLSITGSEMNMDQVGVIT